MRPYCTFCNYCTSEIQLNGLNKNHGSKHYISVVLYQISCNKWIFLHITSCFNHFFCDFILKFLLLHQKFINVQIFILFSTICFVFNPSKIGYNEQHREYWCVKKNSHSNTVRYQKFLRIFFKDFYSKFENPQLVNHYFILL